MTRKRDPDFTPAPIGLTPFDWKGQTLTEADQIDLLMEILVRSEGKAREKLANIMDCWSSPETQALPVTLEHAWSFVAAVDHEVDKRRSVLAAEGLIGGEDA